MLRRPSETRMGNVDFDHRPADDCCGAMNEGEWKDVLLGGDGDDSLFGGICGGAMISDDGRVTLIGGDGDDLPRDGNRCGRQDGCDGRGEPPGDADCGFSFDIVDNDTRKGAAGTACR